MVLPPFPDVLYQGVTCNVCGAIVLFEESLVRAVTEKHKPEGKTKRTRWTIIEKGKYDSDANSIRPTTTNPKAKKSL